MPNIMPEVEHYFIGGVYLKRMQLRAGHSALTHKHMFEHATILAAGTAYVTINEYAQMYDGPTVIRIPANTSHGITAVTDTTWYCVHRTDITDATQIDETLIVAEGG